MSSTSALTERALMMGELVTLSTPEGRTVFAERPAVQSLVLWPLMPWTTSAAFETRMEVPA